MLVMLGDETSSVTVHHYTRGRLVAVVGTMN